MCVYVFLAGRLADIAICRITFRLELALKLNAALLPDPGAIVDRGR